MVGTLQCEWLWLEEVKDGFETVFNIHINIIYIKHVLKSRRKRWAGHVARMGEERGCIWSWWGKRREGDHWGDLGVDGWIILGWICRRWNVGIWIGLCWPRIRDR